MTRPNSTRLRDSRVSALSASRLVDIRWFTGDKRNAIRLADRKRNNILVLDHSTRVIISVAGIDSSFVGGRQDLSTSTERNEMSGTKLVLDRRGRSAA